MPDNSGDAPSGLAEDRIAALEAGFAGLTELLEALRIWEEWAPLIGPGFSVQPSPGLSPIPQRYDVSSDETHRQQLIARRHKATLDQYRSLYCFGFYDADLRLLDAGVAAYDVSNKHRRDFLAFIRLNKSNDADARTKTVAQVVRRSLLKPGFADYGSEAMAQLSDELLRREAEYSVTAAAKAAVQHRFGVGPDPNEEEDDDDEPPSRARRRRPSGRRPRPDFRPTADKGKALRCRQGQGQGQGLAVRPAVPLR
eukprot:jgi/Tetstr1/447513/TSEL_034893.t1